MAVNYDIMTLARKARPLMEKAAQSLSDAEALQIKTMYPKWEKLVELGSVEAEAGFRFYHADALYKCKDPNPTFQADWIPGVGTESLYTRIDETHTGTLEDPIPYDGNMELKASLYYEQDDVMYLCNRDTGIAVHNALSELVGLYVEEVSEDAEP